MDKTKTKTERLGGKFPLGRTMTTPGALGILTPAEMLQALQRHAAGDWGDCCPEDAAENEFALDKYLRILSVYLTAGGVKFWIITEADRSVTTVLLPEEY
jgi:hypothetical protein